jgi:hypothetical protein
MAVCSAKCKGEGEGEGMIFFFLQFHVKDVRSGGLELYLKKIIILRILIVKQLYDILYIMYYI